MDFETVKEITLFVFGLLAGIIICIGIREIERLTDCESAYENTNNDENEFQEIK